MKSRTVALAAIFHPGIPTPWRPWILTPGGAELTRTGSRYDPGGDQHTFGSKGAFGFQHPVRLYLPISKRQEYLQSSGEKVLASFPVQATIHFYNDESDSDEEEQEETQPFYLQRQETEDPVAGGPGATGRYQPIEPGWPGGRSGLHSRSKLPHSDSPGGSELSSPK
ncbi:Protein ripply3 [Tupaia chinensis]|uniref:Protein ripply3 n=1 Tax=Tupaia chinensis TaxID=246437 RepID=L9KYK8_TUPCH|nr:Protein ripply3 [Tupaia chinensis]